MKRAIYNFPIPQKEMLMTDGQTQYFQTQMGVFTHV
jgi:hypothetical protein